MESKPSITVLGNTNVDYFVSLKAFPKIGETIIGNAGPKLPGGKGANCAVAISKLQTCHTSFICNFGNDSNTAEVLEYLKSLDLDLSACIFSETHSQGMAVIMSLENGDNCIAGIANANMEWPEQLTSIMVEKIENCDILVLQRNVPDGINLEAAKIARKSGKFVFFDCGGRAEPLSKEFLENLDLISPNETELSRIVDVNIENQDLQTQIEKINNIAEELFQSGPKNLLVKLGAHGSYFIGTKSPTNALLRSENMQIFRYHQAAYKVSSVIDVTGAGDCYLGAFASK